MEDMEELNKSFIKQLQNHPDVKILISSTEIWSYLETNEGFSKIFSSLGFSPVRKLINLCRHEDASIREQAVLSLGKLSCIPTVVPCLVECRAEEILSELLFSSDNATFNNLAVVVLCNCTKRVFGPECRLRTLYGSLLIALETKDYKDVHPFILKTLFTVIERDATRRVLLQLPLIDACFRSLRFFVDKHKCNPSFRSTAINVDKSQMYKDMLKYPWNIDPDCLHYVGTTFIPNLNGEYLIMKSSFTPSKSNTPKISEVADFDGKARQTDFRFFIRSFEENSNESIFAYLWYLRSYIQNEDEKYFRYTYEDMLQKSTAWGFDTSLFGLFYMIFLSFRTDKKILLQEKTCKVLVDYIRFIHAPNLVAEQLLVSLAGSPSTSSCFIKNGLFSEFVEKKSTCASTVHSDFSSRIVKRIISKLRNVDLHALCDILEIKDAFAQLNAINAAVVLYSNSTLKLFLLEKNALHHLLGILSKDDLCLQKQAVACLCRLYKKLALNQNIEKKPAAIVDGRYLGRNARSSLCAYLKKIYDVTFVLDGGKKIGAVRSEISERSEFFRAMLDGHFSENSLRVIALSDISYTSAQAIFHFLHDGENCGQLEELQFHGLVDVWMACDQLLITDMKVLVEEKIFYLGYAFQFYKQVKKFSVRVERTLHMLLTIETKEDNSLWEHFKEFLMLDSSYNFYGDIENMILKAFH